MFWPPPKLVRDWSTINTHDHRQAAYSELYLDLVYVAIIASLNRDLRSVAQNSLELGDFVLLFLPAFELWRDIVLYSTRFNRSDDLPHRVMLALYGMLLLGVAMHIPGGIDAVNLPRLAVSAALAQLLLAMAYARVAWHLPRCRVDAQVQIGEHAVRGLVWMCTGLFTESHSSARRALFTLMCVNHFVLPVLHTYSLPIRHRLPIDIHHWIERHELFFLIVLGDAVTAVAVDPRVHSAQGHVHVESKVYVAAGLGFLIGLWLKMLYGAVAHTPADLHACRRSVPAGFAWAYLHPLLLIGVSLVGASLEVLCELEAEELPAHQVWKCRWFVAGGFAASLCAISCMALIHKHPARHFRGHAVVQMGSQVTNGHPHSGEALLEQGSSAFSTAGILFYVQVGAQLFAAALAVALNGTLTRSQLPNLGLLAALAGLGFLCVVLDVCREWSGVTPDVHGKDAHGDDARPDTPLLS